MSAPATSHVDTRPYLLERVDELVGGHIVLSPHHKVTKILARNRFLVPQPPISKFQLFAVRNFKPPVDSSRISGWQNR